MIAFELLVHRADLYAPFDRPAMSDLAWYRPDQPKRVWAIQMNWTRRKEDHWADIQFTSRYWPCTSFPQEVRGDGLPITGLEPEEQRRVAWPAITLETDHNFKLEITPAIDIFLRQTRLRLDLHRDGGESSGRLLCARGGAIIIPHSMGWDLWSTDFNVLYNHVLDQCFLVVDDALSAQERLLAEASLVGALREILAASIAETDDTRHEIAAIFRSAEYRLVG
jgi:hypothetical protein